MQNHKYEIHYILRDTKTGVSVLHRSFPLLVLLLSFLIPVNGAAVALPLTQSPVTVSQSIAPMQSTPPTVANWAAWKATIISTPLRQTGCFVAKYPATIWQATKCGPASTLPHEGSSSRLALQPSTFNLQPLTVGNGNDYFAQSTSFIGSSVGSFLSTSGITSETGSVGGLGGPGCGGAMLTTNCYGLQINAQRFFGPVTTAYSLSVSTYAWEQFIYSNTAVNGGPGAYIEFWLLGYRNPAYSNQASCPTSASNPPTPPGSSGWIPANDFIFGASCYLNTAVASSPSTPGTGLGTLSLAAYSNYLSSGNDQVSLCITTYASCYSYALTDGVLNLYQYWVRSEFNVFGDCCLSRANFNSGTSITVLNALKDQSGNAITPTCVPGGSTGETNNLNLAPCSASATGISFDEGLLPQNTMTVSYSTPGGAGLSSPPTFNYVDQGSPASYTLTNTPTPLSVDSGTSWSVTPSTLVGSGSLEQWQSPPSQSLSGTSATETLNFAFYHQYLQTLSYSIVPSLNPGSPSPPTWTALQFGVSTPQALTQSPTGYWYDAGSSWTVSPNPLGGSTSSEQWVTTQATSGTITSAQTINFAYSHQFTLTTAALPSTVYGTTSPAPGTYWEQYESPQKVSAFPNAGYGSEVLYWIVSAGITCPVGPACTFNMPDSPASVTVVFEAQLFVALQPPPANGGTVTKSTVTLSGVVTALGTPFSGATVKLYLRSPSNVLSLVCTVSSSASGKFSCVASSISTLGKWTWYAVATKAGWIKGTSPTWNFTRT